MKIKFIIPAIIIVIILVIAVFVLYGSESYSSFKEAKANPGKTVQVMSHLMKDKPIEQNPDGAYGFHFYVKDQNNEEMKIYALQAKPMHFEKTNQVVIIGHMADSGFIATNLLLKCPSKYTKQSIQ